MSQRVVPLTEQSLRFPAEPDRSHGHFWQTDEGIIAQSREAFHRHVSGKLHSPRIVLCEQDGPNESGHGSLIREDSDDLCTALDLANETLDRVGRVYLDPVFLREGHVGQRVCLGRIH